MTIVDLRQNYVFPTGAFVIVRTGLMLRMSLFVSKNDVFVGARKSNTHENYNNTF
jgi:hypothetical protein